MWYNGDLMDDRRYDIVIYHAGCPDGLGAAWAAWRHLGYAATYIPMLHGDPVPFDAMAGKRVLLVDFAFPRDVHLEAMRVCEVLHVVDHHVHAMEDVGDLPGTWFDMKHSGATLTWAHFSGGRPCEAPEVLRCIEDRDIARWKIPRSPEYLAWFDSFPLTLEAIEAFDRNMRSFDDVVEMGAPILAYRRQAAARTLENMCLCTFKDAERVGYGGIVPVCNVSSRDLVTDVCDAMMSATGAPVAAAWYYDGRSDCTRFSLRSSSDEGASISVAHIAAAFGGGGHENAAGFRVDGCGVFDVFDAEYPRS